MMGAGKSTVGALVADRLGWRFIDLDDEICRRHGMTVAEIFAARGESGFRAVESRTLRLVLEEDADVVLSVGGGAVLDAGNRSVLRAAGTVAWLRARPETLAARVGSGTGRPLLAGTGGDGTTALVLEELTEQRGPLYESVADVVLDTDSGAPEELSERLLALVSAGGPP